jgi:hypothetical protein
MHAMLEVTNQGSDPGNGPRKSHLQSMETDFRLPRSIRTTCPPH